MEDIKIVMTLDGYKVIVNGEEKRCSQLDQRALAVVGLIVMSHSKSCLGDIQTVIECRHPEIVEEAKKRLAENEGE